VARGAHVAPAGEVMTETYHRDGVIVIRSARLAAELERAGCRPLKRNDDGSASFARTQTVLNHLREYTATVDMARARRSFRNEPRISK